MSSTTRDLEKLDLAADAPQIPEPIHYVDEGRRDSKLSGYDESVQYGEGRDSTATYPQSLSSSPLRDTETYHDTRRERRQAYMTVLGGFLALFCAFGQMNAFGTFQTYYAGHQLQAYSPSTISWIGSLQLWVFFSSGWPVGWLFDIYGPKPLMFTGSICVVLGLVLTSFSTHYYHYILCQGILFGLGVGLLFYPSLASIATHFTKYRATALGVCAAGSSLGGVIFPIMLQRLFDRVGFGWAVRAAALLSGVLCLLSVFTVSTAILPRKRNPADCCAPNVALSILKDSRFVLLAAGSSLVALGKCLFIPLFYVVDYAQLPSPAGLSLKPETAFVALAVMNAGGVFGRVAPAILSDVIGRFNLLAPSAFLSGLLTIACWLTAKDITRLMVYSVLYGFCSGAFISVVTPCVAQISDIREIGSRIGALYSVISIPALVGGPIAGALLAANSHHSFTGPILFSGVTVISGSFFIVAAKLAVNPELFARV